MGVRNAISSVSGDTQELSALTVPSLKTMLKAQGLAVSGKKAELIERLLSQVQVQQHEQYEPVATEPDSERKAKSTTRDPFLIVDSEVDPLDAYMTLGAEILSGSGSSGSSSGSSSSEYESTRKSWKDDSRIQSRSSDPAAVRGDRNKDRGRKDSGELVQEIQRLINERSEFRKARDFEQADALRDRLRFDYAVEIYDHKGLWEGPGGLAGPMNLMASPNFKAPPTKEVACKYNKEEVQDLVYERTAARRSRDFDRADDIRNLLADNGVELYDKINEWASFDGAMSGLQSTDGYYGGNNFSHNYSSTYDSTGEESDTIKTVDEHGEVKFKVRSRRYKD
jgi:cysteinyl-tRNA synthetase